MPASTTCSRCAATRRPAEAEWTATEGGLSYSRELIELIRDEYEFAIGAACFPEVAHPRRPTPSPTCATCKEKVDAGARFLITQLFFDNQAYYDFVARARELGIDVPIIPGIMPITDAGQIKRFTEMCGAKIPDGAAARARAARDQPERGRRPRRRVRDAPVRRPAANGAPGIHFYTLNRSPATRAILSALRLHGALARRRGRLSSVAGLDLQRVRDARVRRRRSQATSTWSSLR